MIINRIIFLIILFAAFRTKLDYVYLVWFFIINDAPGRLFSGGGFGDIRLPLYPVIPGISLSFQDLFIILYLIKFLIFKKNYLFIFKKEFLFFYLIGIIIFLYSFLLGMNENSLVVNLRSLIPWSLVIIIPAYFYNSEIIKRVSLFLFPVVFISILSQIYSYFTGNYLDYYLRGLEYKSLTVVDEGLASRSYSAVYITLFSIIQAFYFYYKKKPFINSNYLAIILITGYLSIFLTATRGWIIALGFLLTGIIILFWFVNKGKRVLHFSVLSIIVFYIIFTQIPIVQKQFKKSYERLVTLESLAKGDLTAEGTLQRLDVRGPRVMEKFKESPIIGLGFSDEYNRYADAHVGHQTILLNVGILGYIYLNLLFFHFCLKLWKLSIIPEIRNHMGKAPMVYVLALLAVYIIHGTSTQFWGYNMGYDPLQKSIFYGFFFAAVNVFFLDQKKSI